MRRMVVLALSVVVAAPLVAQQPIVVVDPGHGGRDRGAPVNGLVEKHLTLSVAHALVAALIDRGIDARLTRNGDQYVALEDRIGAAESIGAVAFVSVHFAASPEGAEEPGGFIFVPPGDDRSAAFGAVLRDALAGLPVPFAEPEGRNFVVLRTSDVPAVLLELGNISDPAESNVVAGWAYRQAVARALASGISAFVSSQR